MLIHFEFDYDFTSANRLLSAMRRALQPIFRLFQHFILCEFITKKGLICWPCLAAFMAAVARARLASIGSPTVRCSTSWHSVKRFFANSPPFLRQLGRLG